MTLTNREAAIELGCTRATCYGCELPTESPRYDADCHAYCPECAETYATDCVERWVSEGARVHDAVVAECDARGVEENAA